MASDIVYLRCQDAEDVFNELFMGWDGIDCGDWCRHRSKGCLPKETRENVGIFPKSVEDPILYPQFGNFFPILPFIFGRFPILKTVKKMEVGFG